MVKWKLSDIMVMNTAKNCQLQPFYPEEFHNTLEVLHVYFHTYMG